jgi:tRNA 5-methylaminomethyl-2-thiouridine biosynthesis bifunctional protein
VLDSCFQDGELFFATWSSWVEDPQRPHLLHYVAITSVAPARDVLLRNLAAFPSLAAQAAALDRQWVDLLPGFHRIVLQHGQVRLTVCIGPVQPMLREQQFMADAVCLPAVLTEAPQEVWDRWNIKALTRLCRRGTSIQIGTAPAMLQSGLEQAGFVFETSVGSDGQRRLTRHPAPALRGQYQPRWEPGSTRHPWRQAPSAVSSCVIVGAGLAGALVAAALAPRGWQVTVLDASAQPASAASGLPVGLFAPQISRDDNTRSRLSRAGVKATLQMCHALLDEGDDWSLSGVLELQRTQGFMPIRHAVAGWIKPARLVQACLARPGVQFIGNSDVQKVVRQGDHWELSGADGTLLGRARHLVVAGAAGSVELLDRAADAARDSRRAIVRMATMQPVGGMMSWGLHQAGDSAAFPPIPVNGQGSFVAHVPIRGAPAWFAGATYETAETTTMRAAEGHVDNLQRLSRLLPQVARRLSLRFSQSQVQAWNGTRCTTLDRLPAVGALDAGPQPNLWVSTGFGSRGLTYAALCAELLAAQLGGEPLPVEASLAKCIAATRPQLLHHL